VFLVIESVPGKRQTVATSLKILNGAVGGEVMLYGTTCVTLEHSVSNVTVLMLLKLSEIGP
jgi:hypothetical protein